MSWELYDYDPSLSAAKERKRHWQINYIKHKLSSNKKLIAESACKESDAFPSRDSINQRSAVQGHKTSSESLQSF